MHLRETLFFCLQISSSQNQLFSCYCHPWRYRRSEFSCLYSLSRPLCFKKLCTKGGKCWTGKGPKPIKCVLLSKLLLWATWPQTCRGPLEDCVEHAPVLPHLMGRELGVYTSITWQVLVKGAPSRINSPVYLALLGMELEFEKRL